MKACWIIPACVLLLSPPLRGDTVYQTNADGKEIALQRDAIVIQQDFALIVYKHFDLKDRRVKTVSLNKGSLPIRVEISNAGGRAQIVAKWKAFGYKASITDQAGKISHVCDVFIDFYPPGGHGSLLESLAALTAIPLQLDNGGGDQFDFDKIDHVEVAGDHLNIFLRDGKTVSGKFLMPTTQPAEVRVLGITDQYDPASHDVFDFSVPLSQLKMISFD